LCFAQDVVADSSAPALAALETTWFECSSFPNCTRCYRIGMPTLGSVMPVLPVRSLDAALDFYREKLGFTVRHREDGGGAIIVRDAAEFHLTQLNDESWRQRADFIERPVKSGAESLFTPFTRTISGPRPNINSAHGASINGFLRKMSTGTWMPPGAESTDASTSNSSQFSIASHSTHDVRAGMQRVVPKFKFSGSTSAPTKTDPFALGKTDPP
jgi:hypothetical protein